MRRYEWDIYNAVVSDFDLASTKYGDYGNKHPIYVGEAAFSGSCSIKYTIEKEFVIYRGHVAKDHPHGNGQYITFAKRLISTTDYAGSGFSWGDKRIEEIGIQSLTSPKPKPGSATSWVEITQNHHITLLHSLL